MLSVPAASGLVKPFRSFPGRGAAQSREPGTSRGMRNENQCPSRKREEGLPCAGSRARGSCGMRWPQPPPWLAPGPGALTHRRPGRHAGLAPGAPDLAAAPRNSHDACPAGGSGQFHHLACRTCDRTAVISQAALERWVLAARGRAWPRRSRHHPARLPGVPSLQGAGPATALYNAESAFRPQQAGARPGSAQLPGTRAAGQRPAAGPATGSRRRCRARRGGGCGAGSSRRPRAGRWWCPCPARSRPAGSRR